MICVNCLTWPVSREGELCAKCEREQRAYLVAMDLGSAPSVTVRALCEIRDGQLVVLDCDVPDQHSLPHA